jgi:hypothetical protein
VPAILDTSIFQVVPQNPGVVDVGLTAGEVPRRSVVLTARDANGQLNTADYSVLQNFLTGYGVQYTNNCPQPAGAAAAVILQACSGSESVVSLSATSNGYLRGNALFRFERLRGDFLFTQCGSPPPVNPALGQTTTQNSDHTGLVVVCLRATLGAPTQLATYRVIDVATGVYADQVFTISGDSPAGALTPLPATISFTGGSNTRCGTGSADVFVFDGTPPYTATSTSASVSVSPSSSPTNPGRFTITQINTNLPCITGAVVVLLDALGRRGQLTVDQVIGPAPTAIMVSPNAITLTTCGQTATVSVAGGTGNYTANSTNPAAIAAMASGAQISVTRLNGQGGLVNLAPLAFTVAITDGASSTSLTVTAPTNCP